MRAQIETIENKKFAKEFYSQGKSVTWIARALNIEEHNVFNMLYYDRLNNRELKSFNSFQDIKNSYDKRFVEDSHIKTVLDAYAGPISYYKTLKNVNVIANDKDQSTSNDHHLDAKILLAKMIVEKKKFDLVDLDPYGSCFYELPLATMISKKGLIVSYGDYNNWRFKRYDIILSRYYKFKDIKTIKDFEDVLVLHTQYIIEAYGKKKSIIINRWQPRKNFFRVYFKLEPLKFRYTGHGRKNDK